ncbi:MAG: branched-chain amino acid ABC transporter permease [Anaerolineales bacterium]|jgi:branched-chain amino acid transport system permease protein
MTKKISSSTLWFLGSAFLIYAVLEVLISTGVLSTFWNTIIRIGGVMAIVSIGLNLIYGFNGQFSLGQWGFYAIGAYAAADVTYRWAINKSADGLAVLFFATMLTGIAIIWLRRKLANVRGLDPLSAFTIFLTATIIMCFIGWWIGTSITPALTGALNMLPAKVAMQIVFAIAVVLAAIMAAEVSFLFGLPILSLGSDYFGIATLGFAIIVKILLDNSDTLLGFEEMKGARGMVGIPKETSLFWVFLFLVLVIIITRNLLRSSYGRAIISVREDEIAAKAMGIDIADYKIQAFVLGSFFAGLAGALYAHINGFLHPNTFNFIRSFDPMIIIVFGGLGSISGTVFAAFAWALILEGVLRLFLPQGFETWRFVVYPILLLVTMLLRPKGIFGDYEIPFLRQVLPKIRKPAETAEKNSTVEANS